MCVTWAGGELAKGGIHCASARHGTTGPGVSTAQWIYPGQCEEGIGKECRAEPSFEWSWKIRSRLKLVPRLQSLNNFVLLDPNGIQTGVNEHPKKLFFFYFPEKHVQSVCGYKLRRTKWGYLSSVPGTTAHQQTTDGVVLLCLHVDRSMRSAWSMYGGGGEEPSGSVMKFSKIRISV